MFYVTTGVVFIHGRHAVSHGDPLSKGEVDSESELSEELGLSCEDEEEGVLGVHFEVEEDAELVEERGAQEVGFIEDEDGLFSLSGELSDAGLDFAEEEALAADELTAESAAELSVSVEYGDGREGEVNG